VHTGDVCVGPRGFFVSQVCGRPVLSKKRKRRGLAYSSVGIVREYLDDREQHEEKTG